MPDIIQSLAINNINTPADLKQFLRRGHIILNEINDLEQAIQFHLLRATSSRQNYNQSKISNSPNPNNDQSLISYIELTKQYDSLIINLNTSLRTINNLIYSVEIPIYRLVLINRYILPFTAWHNVAGKLHYETQSIKDIHTKAINHLLNKIKNT